MGFLSCHTLRFSAPKREELTMAEAILSAVVGDAVGRVISLLTARFSDRQNTEAKLRRICQMLVRISAVVEDAKRRQIANHAMLQWLSELIGGEYQDRCLLDTAGCREQHELQEENSDKVVSQAISSLSLSNPAKRIRVAAKSVLSWRRHPSADEVDSVLESLERLCADLGEFIMLLQHYRPIRRPLAANIFINGHMFGRHVEKERILNFLLHDSGESGDRSAGIPELEVLPIVGDDGVGKTTLVQHACDDFRVRKRFPVIILFNFSCIYAVTTRGGTTIHHAIGDAGDLKHPFQQMKGNFCNKRILVVFEDVDMRKKQMLGGMLPSLKYGKKGSKIVFTTNDKRVTSMGTVEPITLKLLPFPEYWFFFKAHAFAGRDVEENSSLVSAGKAIATKLNRSLFGAKIVGGLLKDNPNPKFWCKVLRSNIGGLCVLGDGINYVVDLSDNLLPDGVKVHQLCISKGSHGSQTGLTRLQDLYQPHDREAFCLADDARFARVLLCKSVLPFYNHYYIASCTAGLENSC